MISRPFLGARLALTALVLALCVPAASAQSTQVLGFADINYVRSDRDIPEGFVSGQLVGHAVSSLSDRLTFSTEVSATARPTGYVFEVERLILRYDFSDLFKLSAGRYHTPIGYWNTAFHHGLWLQTSTARPEMIRFGSPFIPVHFVGLLAEGTLPSARLGLSYTAGIGNGRQENVARGGDAGDVNDHLAWVAGASLRPAYLFGLQVGAALYKDRVAMEAGPVDESIYSAHVAWLEERPEVIAEYAHITHEPALSGDGRATNNAFYVQVAYRLRGGLSPLKPYARVEHLDTAADDPIFATLQTDYEAAIVGLRYDFAPFAALKGEYRNERFAGSDRFNSFYVQVAFTFPSMFMGEDAPAGGTSHVLR